MAKNDRGMEDRWLLRWRKGDQGDNREGWECEGGNAKSCEADESTSTS